MFETKKHRNVTVLCTFMVELLKRLDINQTVPSKFPNDLNQLNLIQFAGLKFIII